MIKPNPNLGVNPIFLQLSLYLNYTTLMLAEAKALPDVADAAVANEVTRGVVEGDARRYPVKGVRLCDSPSKDGHADEPAADGAEDGDLSTGL